MRISAGIKMVREMGWRGIFDSKEGVWRNRSIGKMVPPDERNQDQNDPPYYGSLNGGERFSAESIISHFPLIMNPSGTAHST